MKQEGLNRESGTDIHPSSLNLHPFCRVLGDPFDSPSAPSFRALVPTMTWSCPTSRGISPIGTARSGQALGGHSTCEKRRERPAVFVSIGLKT